MPTYAPPTITKIPVQDLPNLDPEDGVNYANLNEDRNIFPVLLMGSYTYCALSYNDNREALCIRAYDTKGNITHDWVKEGARYLKYIIFANGTATFYGQDGNSVSLTQEELTVPPAVHVVDSSTGPKLPSELCYSSPDPANFPFLVSGPYRFWPASRTDGSDGFVVLVCNMHGALLYMLQCPGAHTIVSIDVDALNKKIKLLGTGGKVAYLPWDDAIAAYTCHLQYTKADLLFLAGYFNLTLNDEDAEKLAEKLPPMTCATCCVLDSAAEGRDENGNRETRGVVGAVVGSVVGGLAGAIAGFLVGGPAGAGIGWLAGSTAGLKIGETIEAPHPQTGYSPTTLEREQTFIEYESFPIGPFDNGALREDLHNLDFPRYQSAPYAAAVAKSVLVPPNKLLAYSPTFQAIKDWPRDPASDAYIMQNGERITKYIFVIIKTDVAGRAYQMRINPENFYIHTKDRINHSQLSEGYRFWCLVGEPHMQVYAAGSIYVNATKKKIIGVDSRSGHYYTSFTGRDTEIMDAAVGFLGKLGYDTLDLRRGSEMTLYLQQEAEGNM